MTDTCNPNSVFDLFMDIHEPIAIFKYLTNLGLSVCRVKLPIGDYVYGNTVIERKTIEDFLSSAKSYKGKPARLWTQLINMKNNYERCYLFISGKREDVYRTFQKEDYIGTLAAVLIGFGIPPVAGIEDDNELAELIYKIYQRDHKEGKSHRPIPKIRMGASMDERVENMIGQVEKVGPTRAKQLLKVFGSMDKICNTPLIELEKIVPPKVANKIHDTLEHHVKYWDKDGT